MCYRIYQRELDSRAAELVRETRIFAVRNWVLGPVREKPVSGPPA